MWYQGQGGCDREAHATMTRIPAMGKAAMEKGMLVNPSATKSEIDLEVG